MSLRVSSPSLALQVVCGALVTVAAVFLVVSRSEQVLADNHLVHFEEILAGANGNSRIQFIVIEQEASGQNRWGPTDCAQSAAMLVFSDASGRETGKFKFPENPPTNGTLKTLIATAEFANLPGAPIPDIIMPPLLNPISGKVCFRTNPANPFAFGVNLCVSYGNFTGNAEGGGSPAPALPVVNTVSLRRVAGGTLNANFQLNNTPTPTNIAGATFSIPVATQVEQGANLFNLEPFLGNGRTCGSCHVADLSFRMSPGNVQARFAALMDTFDPLFVAETKPSSFDAGFDFNLNTLVLTAPVGSNAPCTGELRGIITTGGGGRAKVLGRVSETSYLIYGGRNPVLSGTVSDGVCSGAVGSVSDGDLNALEDPRRVRTSLSADFPQGRALILENIEGFLSPPVFRKSPALLNLGRTAPFGFSGNIPDLDTFTTGAVRQHFPRTLARNDTGMNPDFRLPTPEELAAMQAFMLAQEFPAGSDPNKFDLNRFAITLAQQNGRKLFFGTAKCSQCHGGPVLAQTTVSIQGKPIGVNASFNTGVVNQLVNSSGVDNLPCEPSVGACGSREFNVPQLFNVMNLGPFFHDGSAPTLSKAVEFYTSPAFNNSPAGLAIGTTVLSFSEISDIVAFLESLVVSAGPATPVVTARSLLALEDTPLTVTLTGSDADGDSLTFAIAAGPANGSLSSITSLTAMSAQVTYTPGANFNGSDTFSFTAADSAGRTSAAATITISVRAVNDGGVADPQNLTTAEDTPVGFTLSGSDSDGAVTGFSIVTQPMRGFLSGAAPNMTYTPFANLNGADGFTFRIQDGGGQCSDAATVNLTVTPVNDPPGASVQSATIAVDTPTMLTLTGSDADGDSLNFSIITGPSNGSLSSISPLTTTSANVTYTPNLNFGGLDSFVFGVSDPSGISSTAAVTLSVGPPQATSASLSTAEETALSLTLAASDPNGNSLTFALLTQPFAGSLAGTAPNLTYTPNLNFFGSDSFSFQVTDSTGLTSNTAFVTINVTPVNDSPVANAGADQTLAGTSATATQVVLDGSASSDPDFNGLTFRWTGPFPEGGGTATGVRPTVSLPLGASNITLVVNDGQVDSSPDTVVATLTDFSVGVAESSVNVRAGQSASFTVNVAPQNGPFANAVSLACSLPATLTRASCSLSRNSVTPGTSTATATLTITTSAPSAAQGQSLVAAFWLVLPGLAVGCLVLLGGESRKRGVGRYFLLGMLLACIALQGACGGGGTPPPPRQPTPGTPPGSHTITVTGTSASLQRTATSTLVVQ